MRPVRPTPAHQTGPPRRTRLQQLAQERVRIYRAVAAQGGTPPPRFAAASSARRRPASPADTRSRSTATCSPPKSPRAIAAEPLIELRREEVTALPTTPSGSSPAVRSPADALAEEIARLTGSDRLYLLRQHQPDRGRRNRRYRRSRSGRRATASPPTARTTISTARSTATSTSASSMHC